MKAAILAALLLVGCGAPPPYLTCTLTDGGTIDTYSGVGSRATNVQATDGRIIPIDRIASCKRWRR